jgi:hypothetical protein
MVKRLDRSIEISVLLTVVISHCRKRHQYNDKATQDFSHNFDPHFAH